MMNKEKKREQNKRYYEKNKEKEHERYKKWYEKNKEKRKQYNKQYIHIRKDKVEDLQIRIDKAIEYCEEITSREIDISDTDYDLGQDFTARDILKILRGEDNE